MEYWQISAGYYGRDYSDYFINHGIAFVGGDPEIATMEQVKKGDIVVLKRGMSSIIAVGEVVERDGISQKTLNDEDIKKSWLGDFDGWELKSYCYVDWRVPDTEESVTGLTRGTIKRIYQSGPREEAKRILSSFPVKEFKPEPQPVENIKDEEILEHLISEGMRVSLADDLTASIRKIRLLAWYYLNNKNFTWDDVGEHESRTFLVIPLLLALGWSEQQLKVELPCVLHSALFHVGD